MGSEETGPDPAMLRLADSRVSIPMAGDFDSLNVSVAAGVILFEILRQRTRVV
jgi:23S rRNA (guanosine2251-2'-O)-methyltransferase